MLDALQAGVSMRAGEGPRGTNLYYGHSTCVASKAAGETLGAAKKAILVPVKMGLRYQIDLLDGLTKTARDIRINGRQKKAVLLVTVGSILNESILHLAGLFEQAMSFFIRLGVPVVVATGNQANELDDHGQLLTEIDQYPAVLASSRFPIINVGNMMWNGDLAPDSQRGERLVINAIGEDVPCMDQFGNVLRARGTSMCKFCKCNTAYVHCGLVVNLFLAAPLVAGYVAILLSLKNKENLPFNEEGLKEIDFLTRLRDFLTDKKSWTSPFGYKALRNRISSEVYRQYSSQPAPEEGTPGSASDEEGTSESASDEEGTSESAGVEN